MGMPAFADQSCAVMIGLYNLHFAQDRLARGYDQTSFAFDVSFLERQVGVFSQGLDATSLGVEAQSSAHLTFERLIDSARHAVRAIDPSDPNTAATYFDQPQVRQTLAAADHLLAKMHCARVASERPGQTSAQPHFDEAPTPARPPSTTTQTRGGTTDSDDGPASPIKASYVTLILLIGSIIGTIIAVRLIRRHLQRKRRRARRYPALYATRYTREGREYEGVLHDISGNGAKLAHDAENAPKLKTAIAIMIGADWHHGVIAWNNQHYSGILFNKALSAAQVADIRNSAGISKTLAQTQRGAPLDAA
ncbi:PilZ domain-containing protein [Yoonia sp. SS1-5]|uniref:PilZ domain-containing protein n=1 Tax=Yoonia rhodophyticola TaxID=3137370 RepID=A0AAN0M6Z8_9RHOB